MEIGSVLNVRSDSSQLCEYFKNSKFVLMYLTMEYGL